MKPPAPRRPPRPSINVSSSESALNQPPASTHPADATERSLDSARPKLGHASKLRAFTWARARKTGRKRQNTTGQSSKGRTGGKSSLNLSRIFSRVRGRARSRSTHASALGSMRTPQARELSSPIGQHTAAQVLGPCADSPASDFAVRLKERKQARRIFRLRSFAGVAACGVLIAFLVWIFFFSPVFALDEAAIRVEGVQSGAVSEQEVRAAVEPYVGTSLARVPTSTIEASLASNPLVESATATRTWPRGLSVSVAVRTAAMLEASSGAYSLVDSKGVAFGTSNERPGGLPLVILPESEGRAEAAGDVLHVWDALGDVLQPQVEALNADGKIVSFTLSSGAAVRWGTTEDSALKAQVLAVLVAQREAKVYDVSSPAHPVTS